MRLRGPGSACHSDEPGLAERGGIRRYGDGGGAALPFGARAGLAALLFAAVAAPWPYGCVTDTCRFGLAAVVFLAAATVVRSVDPRAGVAAIGALLAVPLVQMLLRTAPPALALDAAMALWAPAAAWLALRPLARGRRAELMAKVMVAGGTAQAGFGLLTAASPGIYGQPTSWSSSPFGSFVNRNHFAGYVELAALLAFGLCVQGLRRDRELRGASLLWGGAGALMTLAVLASGSRGGLLALAWGLSAFALLVAGRRSWRKGAIVLTASLAVLAGTLALLPPEVRARVLTSAGDASVAYRLETSRACLRLAAARPLLGAGLGSFADAAPPFRRGGDGSIRAVHAENDVFQFLAEAGLLGLVALSLAVWTLKRTLAETLRGSAISAAALAASIGLLLHSFVDFNLRVPSNALALAVCLALALPDRGAVATGRHGRVARFAVVASLILLGLAAGSAAKAALGHSKALLVSDPLARAAALGRALAWNPLSTEAHRDRARALVSVAAGPLRAARLERARDDYLRAIELRPQWAEAWYELAWLEMARGDREAARRSLERALALDPLSQPLARAGQALRERIDQPETGGVPASGVAAPPP